jgi:O-antigen/teichoic acid export membrane protein
LCAPPPGAAIVVAMSGTGVAIAASRAGDAADIRRRAAVGVVSVGLRNLTVRGLGLLGNVALARLLNPSAFGIIAFGLTLTTLSAALSTGGLGASMTRRAEDPTRLDLAVALGFQVAVGVALVVLVAAVAIPLGGAGPVAALMVCAVPIDALRTPAGTVATRRLDFGLLARVEVAETLAFNVAAVGLVAAGAGVWGVAAATLLRAFTGASLLTAFSGTGLILPRLRMSILRPHLRFGVANQATTLLNATRDQGLNLAVAAVGGVAALGVWSLAYRLLQTVLLLLQALWRVSFPATSRLLAAGQNARHLVTRGMRLTALATGVMVVLLAGAAPAVVPTLFGPGWEAAVPILPWGAAGLMVSGPISTVGTGFLWAKGDAGRVLMSVTLQAAAWIGTSAALLPTLGPTAVGIGMFAGSCAVALSVGSAVRRRVSAPIARRTAGPAAIAAVASLAGWLVADAAGRGASALVLSLALALSLYAAGATLFLREDVSTLARLLSGAVRRR